MILISEIKLLQNEYFQFYKWKLFPTESQKDYIDKSIEMYDYIYNWAYGIEEENYSKYLIGLAKYKLLSNYTMYNLLSEFRKENDYVGNFNVDTERGAIDTLILAYKYWFNSNMRNNRPKPRTKENTTNSFHTRSDRFHIYNDKVRISGLEPRSNTIELKFNSGFTGHEKCFNPTINRDNLNNYWVGFSIVLPKPVINNFPKTEAIGIDISSRSDARLVLSNGMRFIEHPKYRRALQNISKSDSNLKYYNEKKINTERSRNEIRDLEIYRKRYKYLTNLTLDFYYKAINFIINLNPQGIVIEDLNVVAMLRKHYIADDIFHAQFGTFKELMKYNCNKYGIPLYLAPKEFNSSNICSCCGKLNKDSDNKIFRCNYCGFELDRDLNAAINLKELYYPKSVFYKTSPNIINLYEL